MWEVLNRTLNIQCSLLLFPYVELDCREAMSQAQPSWKSRTETGFSSDPERKLLLFPFQILWIIMLFLFCLNILICFFVLFFNSHMPEVKHSVSQSFWSVVYVYKKDYLQQNRCVQPKLSGTLKMSNREANILFVYVYMYEFDEWCFIFCSS